MKSGKILIATLSAVLLAGLVPAEAQQPIVMARFVRARLLTMTFGKDESVPILSYQFEVLQEYGYMEPERQAFACPITTSTYRVEMPAEAVVSLFRRITADNYDKLVKETLPQGVRLGDMVLAYIQVAPKCRVLETIPYSEENKQAFLKKHEREIAEGRKAWGSAEATTRTWKRRQLEADVLRYESAITNAPDDEARKVLREQLEQKKKALADFNKESKDPQDDQPTTSGTVCR